MNPSYQLTTTKTRENPFRYCKSNPYVNEKVDEHKIYMCFPIQLSSWHPTSRKFSTNPYKMLSNVYPLEDKFPVAVGLLLNKGVTFSSDIGSALHSSLAACSTHLFAELTWSIHTLLYQWYVGGNVEILNNIMIFCSNSHNAAVPLLCRVHLIAQSLEQDLKLSESPFCVFVLFVCLRCLTTSSIPFWRRGKINPLFKL